MDRQSKLTRAVGEKAVNGADDQNKNIALDKLRQMEWKRNKQDSWHLARYNSKEESVLRERKKKEDDIYFGGKGNQKNKRNRNSGDGSSQPSVPPGFCATGSSVPAPPPVNAWSLKKGSALFNKPVADEVDEDDEVLKMAIQASIKSAEEEHRRDLERLKLSNAEVKCDYPQDTWQDGTTSRPWDNSASPDSEHKQTNERSRNMGVHKSPIVESDSEDEEEDPPASPPPQPGAGDNLHFTDTDAMDELPAEHHRKSYRSKKRSNFNVEPTRVRDNTPTPLPKKPNEPRNVVSTIRKDTAPPCVDLPKPRFSPPPDLLNSVNVPKSTPREQPYNLSSYKTSVPDFEINQNTMMPNNNIPSINSLSVNLESTLSFGANQKGSPPVLPHNQLLKPETTIPDSIQTDIMLHNFIRHEPPSQNNTPQYPYAKPPNDTSPLLNDQDSSSSMSDSSVQSASPYGSYENQIPFGLAGLQQQNSQYPYQCHGGVSPLLYQSLPPRQPIGIVPMNPAHYLHNNMVMSPPEPSQLYHAQLMAMIQYQNQVAGLQLDHGPRPSVMQPHLQPMIPKDTSMRPEDVKPVPTLNAKPTGKSKAEIMIEYQKTLQALNKLQQEWAQVETPTPPPPPLQPFVYPNPTASLPMMSSILPGTPSPTQLSPNINNQTLSLPPNPSNFQPGENVVGRGRGRLN